MVRTFSRRHLQDMAPADLVRHAELLQHELETLRASATQASAVITQEYAEMRERLGAANQAILDEGLKRRREVSFYWVIVAKIGKALNFDRPAEHRASVDEDWRLYAKALQQHICGETSDGPRQSLLSEPAAPLSQKPLVPELPVDCTDEQLEAAYERGLLRKTELRHGAYYRGHCRGPEVARWHAGMQRFLQYRSSMGFRNLEGVPHPADERHYDAFMVIEAVEPEPQFVIEDNLFETEGK